MIHAFNIDLLNSNLIKFPHRKQMINDRDWSIAINIVIVFHNSFVSPALTLISRLLPLIVFLPPLSPRYLISVPEKGGGTGVRSFFLIFLALWKRVECFMA